MLEVGVGEGEIAARVRARYPHLRAVGVDLPDPGLAAQWAAKGILGACADLVALPFRADTFELVLAIEVLEHVADPDAALGEIARVATGTVLLSVPREPLWRLANIARGRYWRTLGNTPGHVQHWGRAGFARLVSRHLDVTRVTSPLPWTMVAARARR